MEYVLYFILGILAGTVILIISMIISSALDGGIAFGEVHVVILKTIPLLTVGYALDLLGTWGRLLSILVWWGALMKVFDLDFWEARLLVVVNWVLNVAAQIGLTVALMGHD